MREEWKKKDPKGKGRGGKDKDKGKDKAREKREQSILPKELKGLMPSYKGQKICFSYNLQGCKETTKDGACHKGLHVCARCGDRNHGAQSSRCDKNAGAYKF